MKNKAQPFCSSVFQPFLSWQCFFILFSWNHITAQEVRRSEIDLDAFIRDNFSFQTEDFNYAEIYEILFQLYQNPIDINTASKEELASFQLLSLMQINQLLDYREKNGKFLSLYELQAVPDLDLVTLQKLLPFLSISKISADPRTLWQRISAEKENHFLLIRLEQNLEKSAGYQSDASPSVKFAGNSLQWYTRYRISHPNDFSFGFTLEKDAGEALVWDPTTRRYGMDFYSYHAYVQNKGRIKKLALGDYQLQFGQGLILAGGFGIGKGSETVFTIRRSSVGVRPYTSVLETGFFRGAAVTLNTGFADLTLFYSGIKRDGSLSEIDLDTLFEQREEIFIESLRTSGLHRTANEISGKGQIFEQNTGANLTYKNRNKNFELGLTFLYSAYDKVLRRQGRSGRDSLLYAFEFRGKNNYNAGLHLSYNWQNFNFFGEAAISKSGGKGWIGGFVSSLSPTVEFGMLYRNYEKNFHSFYGSAFAENSRNINEKGMYWGIKIMPIPRKLLISAYYDRFAFPWLKYRVSAPSDGYEYLARVAYQWTKKISCFVQYRAEQKERNPPVENSSNGISSPIPALRKDYWFNFSYQSEKTIQWNSRLQYSLFQTGGKQSQGMALVQDLGVKLKKFALETRFALFDTDNFDARQYVFEQNVLWAFSIPVYEGQGFRYYYLLRYEAAKNLDFWLRFARFTYSNRESTGSGGNEVAGNKRTEITFQCRIRFL